MLVGPIQQRAITRSKEVTRPPRPRSVLQATDWPKANSTRAILAASPPGLWSSGALKSAIRILAKKGRRNAVKEAA